MTIMEIIRERRDLINEIARKHGAFDLRIFGSVVRGEDRSDSDIDILIKATDKTSPWFPGGLIADLEEILGRKVEVVTENGLHPLIRDRILDEAKAI